MALGQKRAKMHFFGHFLQVIWILISLYEKKSRKNQFKINLPMRVTQILKTQVLKVLFLKLLLQADCAVLQFAGWRQFGRHLQPDCAVLQFQEQRQFGRHLQLQRRGAPRAGTGMGPSQGQPGHRGVPVHGGTVPPTRAFDSPATGRGDLLRGKYARGGPRDGGGALRSPTPRLRTPSGLNPPVRPSRFHPFSS